MANDDINRKEIRGRTFATLANNFEINLTYITY